MQYRPLGRTGVQVSVLGVGCNQFGRVCDEKQTAAIVNRALELGVNFFDTAESYGNGASEEVLGKALAAKRGDAVIATKTGGGGEPAGKLSRRRIVQRLDASLKRLGTDYVDVYYLHSPDAATPLDETLRALDDLVRAGKIRYPAISNHPAWQVADAVGLSVRHGWSAPVASQMEYSLVARDVEQEMIPACAHFGVSLVPYFPLAGGFLTGKYQRGAALPPDTRFGRAPQRSGYLSDANFDKLERYEKFAKERGHTAAELAVAWLLAHPVVCSVIAGATQPEQIAANAKAAEWTLTTAEVAELA